MPHVRFHWDFWHHGNVDTVLGGQCQELPLFLMSDHHRGQTPELPDQWPLTSLTVLPWAGPTQHPLGYGEQPLTHPHTCLWKESRQLAVVWKV